MPAYRNVKKFILLFLLSVICFLMGKLVQGKLVTAFPSLLKRDMASTTARPPAPIMQKLQELQERIKENPRDSEAYSELADLYFQANKFPDALALYQKAVRWNGNDVVSRNDLALCYHILHRDTESMEELNQAIKISPRSQHLWLTLGVIKYETGRMGEARQALKHAYVLDPKSEVGLKAKSMLSSL